MRMRSSLLVSVACAALLATAAGCGSSGSSGSESNGGDSGPSGTGSPIRIGSLESTSGPAATIGGKMQQGLQLAIDQINTSGGINGRQLKLSFFDPAGDTSTAVSQTRTLLTQDKVDAIVGGGSQSGIALAMDQETEKAGKLFMSTEGAKEIVEPSSSHPLTFKSTFNDTVVLQRIISYWKSKGITKVGFMPDTSGFGQSAEQGLKSQASKAGIDVTYQPFDPTATDLTPQLTKILNTNPQSILLWTTTGASTVFLKNAKQLMGSRNINLMEGYGSVDPRYMQQAGSSSGGAVLAAPKLPIAVMLPDSDQQQASIQKFETAFKQKFGSDANAFAGESYDAMMAVAKAMKQAHSTDSKAVAAAIAQIKNYVGVTGIFNYSANDHSGLTASSVAMIQWNGSRFVPASG